MLFADLDLARRLEAAEGYACAQFALARRRVSPESASEAVLIKGADVVYDGPESPTTQTFGLGMFFDTDDATLEQMEQFFLSRGAPVQHEVCPFVGAATLQLLCARGYKPIEVSNVLYRLVGAAKRHATVNRTAGNGQPKIRVRVIGPGESDKWTRISARGWAHEHPELEDFMFKIGALVTAREGSACFLAEIDGEPGAAGALSIHQGVALFAGASTVPELRRRGLQSALLEARLRYARKRGCDVAMMVTETGSNSQRNAERQGFQVAYTRVKWKKDSL
ncbi:MAG TPA: GNAT family N-acetyltransferase [Terracidiphilus sp.]|nr:GNAT family N-acetyltransferase [Terracidiphilus sp.]